MFPNLNREDIGVYLSEVAKHPRLTEAEESDLGARSLAGDVAARDRLVRCNLHLVVKLARAARGRPSARVGLVDLIAEGNLSLVKAANTFEPGRGFRFATHVKMHVRSAFRDLRLAMNPLRISRGALSEVTKFRRAAAAIEKETGSAPTFERVAEWLDLSPRSRAEMRHKLDAIRHADYDRPADDDEAWFDQLAVDRSPAPPDEAQHREDLATLVDCLDRIDPQDAQVIRLRYGIGGGEPMTQAEVARAVGIPKGSIYYIERVIKGRLAEALAG